jgi:hypothetical protein
MKRGGEKRDLGERERERLLQEIVLGSVVPESCMSYISLLEVS